MSKRRSRGMTELERLEDENKNLNEQIKHLKRKLKELTKINDEAELLREIIKEQDQKTVSRKAKRTVCPDCKEDNITITKIGSIRELHKCNNCGFFKSYKV